MEKRLRSLVRAVGGKTTICSLIPRFYDVTKGKTVIGQQNIKDVQLKSLRQAIGIVQQDVYLFAGTIRENILYGNPKATEEEMIEATKEEMIEATKKANIH